MPCSRGQALGQCLTGRLCREPLRDGHLRGVADVQRLARKLSARRISLQELCQLYMASSQLPALIDALTSHEGATHRFFADLPCCTHQRAAAVVCPASMQRSQGQLALIEQSLQHAS